MRHKEAPIGFYHEASTSTSHWVEKPATHPSQQCSTIPSFLYEESEEEKLGDYFLVVLRGVDLLEHSFFPGQCFWFDGHMDLKVT